MFFLVGIEEDLFSVLYEILYVWQCQVWKRLLGLFGLWSLNQDFWQNCPGFRLDGGVGIGKDGLWVGKAWDTLQ